MNSKLIRVIKTLYNPANLTQLLKATFCQIESKQQFLSNSIVKTTQVKKVGWIRRNIFSLTLLKLMFFTKALNLSPTLNFINEERIFTLILW